MDSIPDKAYITFSYDDGRKNNYKVALPAHEKFGVPASFAIIANRAIKQDFWHRHMNPREIIDAHLRGVEITSHGFMHTSKFTDLKPSELKNELTKSKQILNGFVPVNQEIGTLCLPFSAADDDVINKAAEHYTFVRGDGARLNDVYGESVYVSSYVLKNNTSFSYIKEKIDKAVSQKKWLVFMLHGVVNGEKARGEFDITSYLLKRTLSYVADLGKEVIQPATFSDIAELRADKIEDKSFYSPRVSEPGAYTLAEAEGFLITYHKSTFETDKVLMTFGGMPSKKTSKGFGSKFALQQGYDHIFVAQDAGSQYQGLSLDDFVRAVNKYVQGKVVFAYGSSLGAYAALYYGGAINASIISAAPKNSAHPLMRKKKFSHVNFSHAELTEVPRAEVSPVILFDPFRSEEAKFIEKWVLPAYPDAHLVKMPYAGHTVLDTMQKSGVLKDFITTYIDRDEIIPFTLKTEDSYIWHAEKGRNLLSEKRVSEAKRHFEDSLRLKINGEAATGLMKVFLEEGEPHAAQEIVDEYFELTGSYKGIPLSVRNRVANAFEEL